jgi:[ribosomal protein S5]-alanine N-acetyltransferase
MTGCGALPCAVSPPVVGSTSTLTRFAWTISALHPIELYIEPWNTGSIRTAERSGYQREGLLRSHQEIGDCRCDMLLYSVIRPETRSSEP